MTQDQTRASYDAVAAAYAEALSDELARKPLDRALLTAFAEQVREVGRGETRVWDVGCGPGHVTAFLAGLGVRAAGVDLCAALAEFRRVLADGGLLLLAVHAGEETRHLAEWFGAEVDVSFRFFAAWLSAELERASPSNPSPAASPTRAPK